MISTWKRAFCLLIIFVIGIYFIAMIFYPGDVSSSQRYENYTLDTPRCRIPFMDPKHQTVSNLFETLKPLDCHNKTAPLVVPGEDPLNPTIKLLKENFRKYTSPPKCIYRRIFRLSEDKTAEDEIAHPIDQETVNISDEFIKVECTYNWITKSVDYFPFIQKKDDVEERCELAKTDATPLEKLNVILLGIDSTSKLQFLSYMKKTLAYMQQNVSFVDLVGYNKISKNTFPNLVAMLTGYMEHELKSKYHTNVLPLIWKEFAKVGYRTLLSEDKPEIFTFTHALKGFKPTDYYIRPYVLAINDTLSMMQQSGKGCINDRLEADVILNWTGDFLDVFKNDSVFALTFLTRMSHNHLNQDESFQDESFKKFIKRLKDKGHLERSIVIIFGVHGIHCGKLKSTYIGRIEEKLPFMFVLLPSWFSIKYPDLYANLQTNSHRLTTAFDIYATLKDILNFTGQVSNTTKGRGVSLIGGIISENRTCSYS